MSAWEKVRLGEVLRFRKEFIQLDDLMTYKRPRVQLHSRGIVVRDEVPGTMIKTKRQQVCRTGEFLVAEIDAKVGGFGMVPPALDGAIVSSHYFLFAVTEERLDRRFLDYFVRTAAFRDQVAAQGSTNYAAIRSGDVLDYKMPLPSLPEQRRVVARIEEVAKCVDEARVTRADAAALVNSLLPAAANSLLSEEALQRWPSRRLEECAQVRSGVTLGRSLQGRTIRLPYLRVANVQDGRLDLSTIKDVAVLESEVDKWKLLSGDILLTEGGDWDKLGRGTVWHAEIPDCIHQNHIFSLRVDPKAFLPEYVSRLLSSPMGKRYFQAASKQTTNLASINQRQLKAFRVFQPPLPEQHRILAELTALEGEVERLAGAQSESAAKLGSLLPAVLYRAFRGEFLL